MNKELKVFKHFRKEIHWLEEHFGEDFDMIETALKRNIELEKALLMLKGLNK